MPFTQYRKFSVQAAATNPGTWGAGGTTGVDLNTGCFGPLDYMFGGLSTISQNSGTYSLTFTAGGGGDVQNACWRFNASPLLGNLTVSPTVGDATTYLTGPYYWENITTGSFTITVTTGTGSVVLPQGRRGTLFFDATNAPRIMSMSGTGTADPLPTGSKVLFYNASAPSGWTAVALNDYAVKIVTNGGGAVASGSVAYSTLFARTATDGYTLLTADIPSHTHTFNSTGSVGSQGAQVTATGTAGAGQTTGATGGGGSHAHSLDMRVLTAAFVLASRD